MFNHKSHTNAAYLEELKTRCCCFGRQSDDMRGACLYMIGLLLLFNNKLLRIIPFFLTKMSCNKHQDLLD